MKIKQKLLVMLSIAMLSVAAAQAQVPEKPEEIARAYIEASRAGDWLKAGSLMHPVALKQLRDMFGPLIAMAKTDKDKQEISAMLGIKDKAEFDKLSDQEVFGKIFGLLTGISPEIKNALNSSTYEIIGSVPEKTDLMHVIFRMQLKLEVPNVSTPISFGKLDVMTLQRFENSWRAILKGDLQGIIQAIVGAIKAEAEKSAQPETKSPPVKKQPGTE